MIAPVKLNLFLHVAAPRQDGLHELFSLAAFTQLGDEIVVAEGTGSEFRIEGPFAEDLDANDESNSMRLAASALQDWCSQNSIPTKRAALRLIKNLPVASGIGGGSSDAATTLLGLEAYWGIQIPMAQRQAIALALGADVPVCLYREPAWMMGIGDKIVAGPKIPSLAVVLVNPLKAVSTRDVYLEFDTLGAQGSNVTAVDLPSDLSNANALFDYIGAHNNDLEGPARRIEPTIGLVLEELERTQPAISRMSGSGATCFGLYEKTEDAEGAATQIAKSHPDWWVKHTVLLG